MFQPKNLKNNFHMIILGTCNITDMDKKYIIKIYFIIFCSVYKNTNESFFSNYKKYGLSFKCILVAGSFF